MNVNKFNILLLIISLILVFSFIIQSAYAVEDYKDFDKGEELIVRFDAKTSQNKQAMNNIHSRINAKVKKEFELVEGMNLIELELGMSIEEGIDFYESNPNVVYAEPNYKRKALSNWDNLKNKNFSDKNLKNTTEKEEYNIYKKELYNYNSRDSKIPKIFEGEKDIELKSAFENLKNHDKNSQETLVEFIESEPNNYTYDADYIDSDYYGDPTYGIIGTITDYSFDLDWYKIRITKSGTIDLTGFWVGDYYEYGWEDDLYIGLYDQDENLIEVSSIYGYGQERYVNINKKVESGVYYMLVLANDEYGSLYVGEPYGVRMFFEPELEYDFNYLWSLENTGQEILGVNGVSGADISIKKAWEKEEGSKDTIVAVIDSGVDYNHSFLENNMWTNDLGYHGYDFVNKDNYPMDNHGHGTHVAGIIAGYDVDRWGEEQPVGVMKNASVMALKGIDIDGYIDVATLVEALEYASLNNVDVINLSLGGSNYSIAEYDAIKNCDAVVVAAAGNESSNNNYTPSYPANYNLPNIISVAATNNKDELADFSNYGDNTVDVAAPGKDIFSLAFTGGYFFNSGTSMATPYVSGIAGLLSSYNETFDYEDIIDIINQSVDEKISLRSKVITSGRVNAEKALEIADSYFIEKGITDVVALIEGNYVVVDALDYEEAYSEGSGNILYDYLYGDSGIVITGIASEDKFMNIKEYAMEYSINSEEALINTPGLTIEEISEYMVLVGFDSGGKPIFELHNEEYTGPNSRQNPAPIGVSEFSWHDHYSDGMQEYEITVQEIIKGDEAWNILYNENQFNDPAPVGMEYILAKVNIKYIQAETDKSIYFSEWDFDVFSDNGESYNNVSVVGPEPELSFELYPGGEKSGWMAVLVNKNDFPVMAINRGDEGEKWFALYE